MMVCKQMLLCIIKREIEKKEKKMRIVCYETMLLLRTLQIQMAFNFRHWAKDAWSKWYLAISLLYIYYFSIIIILILVQKHAYRAFYVQSLTVDWRACGCSNGSPWLLWFVYHCRKCKWFWRHNVILNVSIVQNHHHCHHHHFEYYYHGYDDGYYDSIVRKCVSEFRIFSLFFSSTSPTEQENRIALAIRFDAVIHL